MLGDNASSSSSASAGPCIMQRLHQCPLLTAASLTSICYLTQLSTIVNNDSQHY